MKLTFLRHNHRENINSYQSRGYGRSLIESQDTVAIGSVNRVLAIKIISGDGKFLSRSHFLNRTGCMFPCFEKELFSTFSSHISSASGPTAETFKANAVTTRWIWSCQQRRHCRHWQHPCTTIIGRSRAKWRESVPGDNQDYYCVPYAMRTLSGPWIMTRIMIMVNSNINKATGISSWNAVTCISGIP